MSGVELGIVIAYMTLWVVVLDPYVRRFFDRFN
jgi:hypothetical protein